MLTANEIRQQFFDFFKTKNHHLIPSAPIVVKDDPTLLFTNAGMNQFKDLFLGNKPIEYKRIVDTQKCLRVSGKHNDLEEVGVDTYHHTMFEMLGNWSFGDYFKKEAIEWSWELLTEHYKIPKDQLYVTIFEGDTKEGLEKDEDAFNFWKNWIAEDRILLGNKKDNFWEMGDTGPCGPCSEIHVDCRTNEERALVDGKLLVNADHPQVIEIWNNVFMQFNRLKDGSLQNLPSQHVDTGMGFERLVRVIQGKSSNYDTDVFSGTIAAIETLTQQKYTATDTKKDIAFRVLADHIRAISFTTADGQLPSNTGAGYVIRRILRRAVRYYFSYLDYKQPLLFQLIPVLATQFETVFPELKKQQDFVTRVIKEEEEAFLRTLGSGLSQVDEYFSNWGKMREYIEDYSKPSIRFKVLGMEEFLERKKVYEYITNHNVFKLAGLNKIQDYIDEKLINNLQNLTIQNSDVISEVNKIANSKFILDGTFVFELSDTFGFPIDLTELIANENGWTIDLEGFNAELQKQKDRSRKAAIIDTDDWIILKKEANATQFTGYENYQEKTEIVKYRKATAKGKESYQIVLTKTPFYAESGGQVGDTGILKNQNSIINIHDTKKENDLIIHFTDKIPTELSGEWDAQIDASRRRKITRHHSVTHLMHAALREVLGTHVAQKGSMVNEQNLRFDFSHFAKLTEEEIAQIEKIVNHKIRQNIPVIIKKMPKEEALKTGAMALFGEKYGDTVRVVIMDENYSIELCGGTHVGSTGELNIFKIISESAVAAGVRRIEALAGCKAEAYINAQLEELQKSKLLLKNPKQLSNAIEQLLQEQSILKKKIETYQIQIISNSVQNILDEVSIINTINYIGKTIEVDSIELLKKTALQLKALLKENYFILLTAAIDKKPALIISISDDLVNSKSLDANQIIKSKLATLIGGGGGGQKNLASASGSNSINSSTIFQEIHDYCKNLITHC